MKNDELQLGLAKTQGLALIFFSTSWKIEKLVHSWNRRQINNNKNKIKWETKNQQKQNKTKCVERNCKSKETPKTPTMVQKTSRPSNDNQDY